MRAFDVLICPHVVSAFTLSLDAIKAYEYAAAGRPVVATPTSGFQAISSAEWSPTDPCHFVAKATAMLAAGASAAGLPPPIGWNERAKSLGELMGALANSSASH